jgi:hypothetical protein
MSNQLGDPMGTGKSSPFGFRPEGSSKGTKNLRRAGEALNVALRMLGAEDKLEETEAVITMMTAFFYNCLEVGIPQEVVDRMVAEMLPNVAKGLRQIVEQHPPQRK